MPPKPNVDPEFQRKLDELSKNSPVNRAVQAAEQAQQSVSRLEQRMAQFQPQLGLQLSNLNEFVGPIIQGLQEVKAAIAAGNDSTADDKLVTQLQQFTKTVTNGISNLKLPTPEVKADFQPNIQVSPTPVNIKAPTLDLGPIRDLITQQLPAQLEAIVNNIPDAPDHSDIVERLDKAVELLKDIQISNRMKPTPAGSSGGGSSGTVSVSNFPATQNVAVGASTADVANNSTSLPSFYRAIAGVDTAGTAHRLLTDTGGRMKMSHGQPAAVSATLALLNDQIAVSADGFSDVIFFFGNPPTGSNVVTFEQSPDSTDGITGSWYSTLAFSQSSASSAAGTTATITTANLSYRVSAPAGSWIRARVSTHTSGSIAAQAVTTTASAQPYVTATPTTTVYTMAAPGATIAGLTFAKVLAGASTNATLVKSTAGRLVGWQLTNTTTTPRYLHLHNLTVAPTVGTSSPAFHIAIPPNYETSFSVAQPIAFSAGISYSITAGAGDLDATATTAGDVVGSLHYV